MRKKITIGEIDYYVAKPTSQDEAKAKLQQSRTFSKALSGGACLKTELNKVLKQRKIWDENDDEEIEGLSSKIQDNLKKLEEGGIEVMEARKLAIESNKIRMEMLGKLSVLREHHSLTAEGQADDAYFDCLVSLCCFKDDETKVFKSYEDYIDKSNEDYAAQLAKELSTLLYDTGDSFTKELPENKFLLEFGFINNDLQYIDESGNRVDIDYKPLVKEEEKPVRKPFLKDGNPIEK